MVQGEQKNIETMTNQSTTEMVLVQPRVTHLNGICFSGPSLSKDRDSTIY